MYDFRLYQLLTFYSSRFWGGIGAAIVAPPPPPRIFNGLANNRPRLKQYTVSNNVPKCVIDEPLNILMFNCPQLKQQLVDLALENLP